LVSEKPSDDRDFAVGVDGDIERRVFELLMPCTRPAANFAHKVPPFLDELSEEEEILAMTFGEGFPDLPRFFGLVAKDMGISNGSMDGGEEFRVCDSRVEIETD
jgi:hypothetical protein